MGVSGVSRNQSATERSAVFKLLYAAAGKSLPHAGCEIARRSCCNFKAKTSFAIFQTPIKLKLNTPWNCDLFVTRGSSCPAPRRGLNALCSRGLTPRTPRRKSTSVCGDRAWAVPGPICLNGCKPAKPAPRLDDRAWMPRRKPVFASAEQRLFNDWASPDFSAELPISRTEETTN
jgi:hypothetical protein